MVNKIIKKEVRKDFAQDYIKGEFYTSCIEHYNEIIVEIENKNGELFEFNIIYHTYSNHSGRQAKFWLPRVGGYKRAIAKIKELKYAPDLSLYNNGGEIK